MAKLPKYTLSKDDDKWKLKSDANNRTVKTFETKSDATKGGALSGALGAAGGSVRIHKENGRIQEERTFPRAADPKRSKG